MERPANEAATAPSEAPSEAVEAPSPRTRIRRSERGHHDRATVHAILDAAPLAHLAFAVDGRPFCVPTLHWRIDDRVYFHGAPASHLLRALAKGAEACLVVSILDAFVLARSAFHHSVNYRSVVVFGTPRKETGEAKRHALELFVESFLPGRSETVRPPNELELKGTSVFSLSTDEASAKIRSGGPVDDEGDLGIETWTGLLPVALTPLAPVPEADAVGPSPSLAAARLGR